MFLDAIGRVCYDRRGTDAVETELQVPGSSGTVRFHKFIRRYLAALMPGSGHVLRKLIRLMFCILSDVPQLASSWKQMSYRRERVVQSLLIRTPTNHVHFGKYVKVEKCYQDSSKAIKAQQKCRRNIEKSWNGHLIPVPSVQHNVKPTVICRTQNHFRKGKFQEETEARLFFISRLCRRQKCTSEGDEKVWSAVEAGVLGLNKRSETKLDQPDCTLVEVGMGMIMNT